MSRMAESELISYEWTLQQAEKATDQSSVEKLAAIGPPPYTGSNWRSKFLTARRILGRHGGEYYGSKSGAFGVVLRNLVFSREYTLLDRINFFRGVFQSVRRTLSGVVTDRPLRPGTRGEDTGLLLSGTS